MTSTTALVTTPTPTATPTAAGARRSLGERLAPFELATLAHGTLAVPAAGLVHLQFRRFAGCPVCNLHLRGFARDQPRLRAAGVLTVAVFHSPAAQMRPYQGQLPFPTVPDPERAWYRRFGIERSIWAIARPGVIWAALRGLVLARSNPFAGGSRQSSIPADFLIDPAGVLVGVHYGRHANDQWSVDEVVARAAAVGA